MESNFLSRIERKTWEWWQQEYSSYQKKKMFQQKYKYFSAVFNLLLLYVYLV